VQILLSNDDGIYAPGIQALHDELINLGKVEVVAPASEQSGVGLGTTYRQPLMVQEEIRNGAHWGWTVAGRPADCIKLGVLQFCETKPDLVVSGINSGFNTGISVLYSGTVAAAIEGAFFGITSIAVSLAYDEGAPDFKATARMSVDVIRQILALKPAAGSLWNVNFPASRPGWPVGVKTVSLNLNRSTERVEKRLDPRKRPYYWTGYGSLEGHRMEPGTDVRELADGSVTITPLHFNLTDHRAVAELQSQDWKMPGFQ
jgi:5'-nucleotidase